MSPPVSGSWIISANDRSWLLSALLPIAPERSLCVPKAAVRLDFREWLQWVRCGGSTRLGACVLGIAFGYRRTTPRIERNKNIAGKSVGPPWAHENIQNPRNHRKRRKTARFFPSRVAHKSSLEQTENPPKSFRFQRVTVGAGEGNRTLDT